MVFLRRKEAVTRAFRGEARTYTLGGEQGEKGGRKLRSQCQKGGRKLLFKKTPAFGKKTKKDGGDRWFARGGEKKEKKKKGDKQG